MTNNYITKKDIEYAMNGLKTIDYSIPDEYFTTSYNPYTIQSDVYGSFISNRVNEKTEDKGIEEWVWVTGYKGTDKNMKCRGYQYEMNKQHDMPEGSEINICHSGFHFCDKPEEVFRYYRLERGNRFFEVKALVRRWNKNGQYTIEHEHDKMAAKSIQFVREMTIEEIFKHYGDDRTTNWTYEQMCAARDTSIEEYLRHLKAKKLMELGYSEAFATYVVKRGAYEIACAIGSMPNVSMDVKVLSICMEINCE